MESKYKRILLLVGLDNITDEDLERLKFFLPDEFEISKGKLAKVNRTEVADLMIQSAGVTSAVTKTICIFKKLNYMLVAKSLQEEKEKVDMRYKEKKGIKLERKRNQAEKTLAASAYPRNDAVGEPDVSPHIKPEKQQQMTQKEPIREEELRKDPLMVMVLKTMKPFEFETLGAKQKMFHATVANERDFFYEINSNTLLCDAESDQQMSIPMHIKRKAGETPKISKLWTQPLGTIVNGLFVIKRAPSSSRLLNGNLVSRKKHGTETETLEAIRTKKTTASSVIKAKKIK